MQSSFRTENFQLGIVYYCLFGYVYIFFKLKLALDLTAGYCYALCSFISGAQGDKKQGDKKVAIKNL